MTTTTEQLATPKGDAIFYFTGWLGETLRRQGTITVEDWNAAVEAAVSA